MDLKQLQTFNTICRLKSFTNAAKELYISQSTVTLHIKNLETNLDLTLFSRKNRARVQLTEAGEMLYQYSKQLLSLVNETEQSLANYKKGLSGSLSLAASHTVCTWNLPEIVGKFKKSFPLIDINLFSEFSPKIIEMVTNREVHLGIIRTFNKKIPNSQLITKCIGIDKLSFLYSADYHLNGRNSVTLEEFVQEPLIAYGIETNYWSQIESLYQNYYIKPKICMNLNDIMTVKKMLKLGMGVSILPDVSVKEEVDKGELVKLEDENYPTLDRFSLLIYHKDQIITDPMQKFIQMNEFHNSNF